MKILKQCSLAFLSFILLFLLATFIFHRICLEKEQALLTLMGQLVPVNEHQINVYVEGTGPETIVILSGAGIASPILDFKDLSDSLAKRYKVVIVERAVKLFHKQMSKVLLSFCLIPWLVLRV